MTTIKNTHKFIDELKVNDSGFFTYLMGSVSMFSQRSECTAKKMTLKQQLIQLCNEEVQGIETQVELDPTTFANRLIDEAFEHFNQHKKRGVK